MKGKRQAAATIQRLDPPKNDQVVACWIYVFDAAVHPAGMCPRNQGCRPLLAGRGAVGKLYGGAAREMQRDFLFSLTEDGDREGGAKPKRRDAGTRTRDTP